MVEIQKMNKRAYKILEYELAHPEAKYKDICEELGYTKSYVSKVVNSRCYRQAKKLALSELWGDGVKVAANTLLNLAKNGDREAAKFIMQCNGFIPKEGIVAEGNEISISIKND